MRIFILFYIALILSPAIAWSQSATATPNSFYRIYSKSNPTLNYIYDSATQTHNYSGNWDFDTDGKKDQLFFVGTGGAHLYYYLRIILSSDDRVQNYTFLLSDFPVVTSMERLQKQDFNPLKSFTPLAVYDFDGDGLIDIFMQLDQQTTVANSKQLKRHGIRAGDVLISFKKRKIRLKNYL